MVVVLSHDGMESKMASQKEQTMAVRVAKLWKESGSLAAAMSGCECAECRGSTNGVTVLYCTVLWVWLDRVSYRIVSCLLCVALRCVALLWVLV